MNDSTKIMELLKEVNTLMDKGLKSYFSNCGITVTQLAVVNILGKRDRVKLNELSEELKITPTAVSLIVNRLESQGVIERVRSEEDKRVVYAKLSDKFKATHGNLDNNINGFLSLLLKTKNEKEVQKIFDGLELLKNLLESSENIISDHIKLK
ncbi:MarR family winged helix-turn-helix transcriptional regulator [Clostridium vincentii]|uniref:Putative HTH-type transcriptional regulator YusO n=1 Tax=Clostridium vincentii TaxID=52704 RepID=A0A2T0B7F1_9CLOT|nr:MarR family transcriptional regulator [Clostridium vincentii]PRR79820.1 putative HTH-type transcriptional regulator YusO [Clostridium vincentii]